MFYFWSRKLQYKGTQAGKRKNREELLPLCFWRACCLVNLLGAKLSLWNTKSFFSCKIVSFRFHHHQWIIVCIESRVHKRLLFLPSLLYLMPFSFFAPYKHNELEKIAIVIVSLIFNKHRCHLFLLLAFLPKKQAQASLWFPEDKNTSARLNKSVIKVEVQILTEHSEVCTLSWVW